MSETPRELDWVKERASCSLTEVFQELKREIERDVDARVKLLPPGTHYNFRCTHTENEIRVFSESNLGPRSVVFKLDAKAISAQDGHGKTIFEATVTLNREGRCVAKVDGEECEFWQLRHKALEKLFFETF